MAFWENIDKLIRVNKYQVMYFGEKHTYIKLINQIHPANGVFLTVFLSR